MNSSSLILQDRYLVASLETHKLETQKIAFSAHLVRDILIVERSQLLNLPFYDSACLGVVHYQNQIVPLLSIKQILGVAENSLLQSTLTAVRLNETADQLGGIALVVDRMERNLTSAELTGEHKFQLTDISEQLWHPQR